MKHKIISTLAVVVGLLLVILAFYYWLTPAGALPMWLPGHAIGSTAVHVKHGIACLLLGLGAFAFAWFYSGGKNQKTAENATPAKMQ
jgi:hypothetical protein